MSRDRDGATALAGPRFAAAWAALVYALATFTLAYPALVGQFLVNPRSDQYIAGYAFREFAAASLRAGQGFPQWNPYLFGGMPYIAAMHGDVFYPTFLLRMILPTDVAMTWGFIVHLFLAGFFTYAFLRALGVGFQGALVGGLAYMMSGPIAAYASPGHDGKLFVSALLPLSLWMLTRFVRDGRAWAWGVFALTIGLGVLSPHPQLLQYLLLTSGAFALFLAFGQGAAGPLPRPLALQRLGLALAAVVLGGLMGAIQYLPVREYVDWSPRAGGKGWEHAIWYSMPTEELFNAFVPQFSGMFDDYWGRNGIHLHSEYPGVVVLVLASAGMFAASVRRNLRWFWIGALVVSLLWALGGSTPFYHLVYAVVPGTKFFRAPSTMMFVTMFALAVLAAFGAERIVAAAAAIPRRFLLLWASVAVVLALILAAGLPMAVAEGIASSMSAAGYPTARVARVTELASGNQSNVILGSVRSVVFVGLTLALIWMAARDRIPRRISAWIIAALVAFDLWTIEHRYWIFSPPASVTFASDAAIDAVRADSVPGRVAALDLLGTAVPRDPAFDGDLLMSHRVRSVTGYHGNELGRYQQFETGQSLLRPEFWRHENVRYLYTTLPDSLLPQLVSQLGSAVQLTRVLGPARNVAGSTVYLYRVGPESRGAYVATTAVKGPDDQALATVLDARFDPERAAILDPNAPVPTPTLTTVPAPSGVKATVLQYAPGRINIRLDKPVAAGTVLVVSENYFPGWQATIGGQRVPGIRANYNLIGVPLPNGAQDILLTFTDSAYQSGKTVTLLALAATALAIAAGIVLDRRRSPSAAVAAA